MGLLDRLRPGRDRSPEAGDPLGSPRQHAPGPAEDGDADLIRPTTLKPPAGDWAWLPPIRPSLPEMPLTMTQNFERSLPARVPPKQFLAPLGHAVTSAGPDGVVEGVVVLEPLVTIVGTTAAPAPDATEVAEIAGPLPLAVPAPAGGEDRGSQVQRLPVAQLIGLAAAARLTGAPSPAGVDNGASTERPVVRPEPPAPSPLLVAAPPDGLPAANLPATPLPEELRDFYPPGPAARGESAGAVEAEAQTRSLVGERPPVVDAPVAAPPDAVSGPPVQAPTVDLPLAVPPAPAGSRDQQEWAAGAVPPRSAPDAPTPAATGEVSPSAPQVPLDSPEVHLFEAVAPSPPLSTGPDRAAVPPESHQPVAPLLGEGASTPPDPPPTTLGGVAEAQPLLLPADLPLATPPPTPAATGTPQASPSEEAHGEGTAPVLGELPPLGGSSGRSAPAGGDAAGLPSPDQGGQPGGALPLPAPAPAPRPAPPRAGLGAPLGGLPPTARSYDITSLSRSEQLQVSRALIQSRLANPMGAVPPAPARSPALPGPLAGPVASPDPLPVARPQSFGPPQQGVMPEELPEGDMPVAPLLGDIAPLVAEAGGPSPSPPPVEGVLVRAEIGRIHGVDLSRVPVERGPSGSAEASRIGARAFTSDRGVVIPAGVGSLEGGEGAALLAHELTHVAQRARLTTVPEESSFAGRVLEAEARGTEMVYARGAQGPATPAMVPRAERAAGGSAAPLGGPPASALPLVTAPPSGPDAEAIALSVLQRLSTSTAPASTPVTEVFTAAGPVPAPTAPAPAAAPAVQRAAADALPLPVPDTWTSSAESLAPPPLARPSDEDLTNLSRWLYPLIRFRLKRELREERERTGLLTDHYRKW